MSWRPLPGLQRKEAAAWSGPCWRPRVPPAPKAGQSLGSRAVSLGKDPAALCVARLSLGPTEGRRVVGQMAAGSSLAAKPCGRGPRPVPADPQWSGGAAASADTQAAWPAILEA